MARIAALLILILLATAPAKAAPAAVPTLVRTTTSFDADWRFLKADPPVPSSRTFRTPRGAP